MRTQFSFLTLLLISLACAEMARGGPLTVTVLDKQNGTLLGGTRVCVGTPNDAVAAGDAITNPSGPDEGIVRFQNVAQGEYTLIAHKIGFGAYKATEVIDAAELQGRDRS